jgi:hypothetical protein
MKKVYEKPSMAVSLFDVCDNITNVTVLSGVTQFGTTESTQITNGMTKVNLNGLWHS